MENQEMEAKQPYYVTADNGDILEVQMADTKITDGDGTRLGKPRVVLSVLNDGSKKWHNTPLTFEQAFMFLKHLAEAMRDCNNRKREVFGSDYDDFFNFQG